MLDTESRKSGALSCMMCLSASSHRHILVLDPMAVSLCLRHFFLLSSLFSSFPLSSISPSLFHISLHPSLSFLSLSPSVPLGFITPSLFLISSLYLYLAIFSSLLSFSSPYSPHFIHVSISINSYDSTSPELFAARAQQ